MYIAIRWCRLILSMIATILGKTEISEILNLLHHRWVCLGLFYIAFGIFLVFLSLEAIFAISQPHLKSSSPSSPAAFKALFFSSRAPISFRPFAEVRDLLGCSGMLLMKMVRRFFNKNDDEKLTGIERHTLLLVRKIERDIAYWCYRNLIEDV